MLRSGTNLEIPSANMNQMPIQRLLAYALLSILSTAAPALSFAAGVSDGGGGGVILCLNSDQTVKSVKLVDTVEASHWEEYTPELLEPSVELAKLPWRQQALEALERIGYVDPAFKADLRHDLRSILENMDSYFKSTKGKKTYWPTPQDLSRGRTPPIEPGCQIVAAAIYSDDGWRSLRISHLLWSHLSATDKAALIFHEVVYHSHRSSAKARGLPAPDSSATRVLTGLVFSKMLDGRPEPKVEAERFSKAGDYQPPLLGGIDMWKEWTLEHHIRPSVLDAVSPFVGYRQQKAGRPLYIDKGCKGGYSIEVMSQDSSLQCKLAVELHDNAKGTKAPSVQILVPVSKKQNRGKHQLTIYNLQSATRLDMPHSDMDDVITWENLVLKCTDKYGQQVFTYPTIALSCQGKTLARVEHLNHGNENLPAILPLQGKDMVTPRSYELGPIPGTQEEW